LQKEAKILAGFIGFVSVKANLKDRASPRGDFCEIPRNREARERFTDFLRSANAL
jgi:hypothetical protein